MAGNKFRKFREEKKSEEKKEEEEANSIKRNSNVMLTKDYTILLKAKEEQKYNSKYLFKKGTIIKVVDIIKNMGSIYLKFLMEKNDLTFGYIKEKDEKGIDNIKNIEEKKEEKKENKIDKPKREICHSIRLGDAKKINSPKSQEELNCEKRSKEFLDNIAIPLFFDKILNKNNEEEQDSTDISTTLDNGEYNLNNEKENNFGDEECFRDKKSKEEAVGKSNEKNKGNKKETKDVNPSEKFTLINANPRHRNGNNNNSNLIPHSKKKLAECYKLNKAFKETVGKYSGSPSLEPKYKKGFQVIIRRFDFIRMPGKIEKFYVNKNIGHVFIRFYDENKGIDMIIESTKNENGINEIKFPVFKKEELVKFEFYKILMEEELFDGKDYDYEDIKNYLIKKYKDKNGVINNGKYSFFFNNCFDTVDEILDLYGKSIKEITYYRTIIKELIKEYGDDVLPY